MGEAVIPEGRDAQSFETAYRALRADSSVQFDLTPAPPPPAPPAWLKKLGEFLEQIFEPIGRLLARLFSFIPEGPYARILLWSVIGIAAGFLLWVLYQRWVSGEWRWRRRPALGLPEEVDAWVPDEAPVRAWLEEADALAGQGRFAEAIHSLLLRSVDDISQRRPQLARPSLTGRDLAASELLPERARSLFSGIAQVVERSLFGGRSVRQDEWLEARAAYSEFALATAWRA